MTVFNADGRVHRSVLSITIASLSFALAVTWHYPTEENAFLAGIWIMLFAVAIVNAVIVAYEDFSIEVNPRYE